MKALAISIILLVSSASFGYAQYDMPSPMLQYQMKQQEPYIAQMSKARDDIKKCRKKKDKDCERKAQARLERAQRELQALDATQDDSIMW